VVRDVSSADPNLEDVFLSLTSGALAAEAAQ
jgi:hypothetical protein